MYVFVFSSILSVNHECMHFHTYQVATMEWEAGIFSIILCVVWHVAFVRICTAYQSSPFPALCCMWDAIFSALQ